MTKTANGLMFWGYGEDKRLTKDSGYLPFGGGLWGGFQEVAGMLQ